MENTVKKNLKTNIINLFKNQYFKNGIWLYALQFINTVIPLLTLPYIVRVFGSESYGVISISLNIIGYLKVVSDYGFELTGARNIAISKSKSQIEETYTAITWAKTLILCIILLAIIVLPWLFDFSTFDRNVFYLLSLMVIGSTFSYNWLFQGLQRMKFITIMNVISRSISVVLIFLFVKNPSDMFIYALIYSSVFVINALISFIIIKKIIKIKLLRFNWLSIKNQLYDGFHIFTTSIMSKIFASFSITVLGIFATKSDVGIFSAIQKIPLLIIMIYMPISQVIFPYVSKKFGEDKDGAVRTIRKLSLYIISFFTLISIVLILSSKFVVYLLFGSEYSVHYLILIPLLIWVIFSIANNILGIQILVGSGRQTIYSKIFTISVLMMIGLNLLMGYWFGLMGVSIATALSEIALTSLLLLNIRLPKKV